MKIVYLHKLIRTTTTTECLHSLLLDSKNNKTSAHLAAATQARTMEYCMVRFLFKVRLQKPFNPSWNKILESEPSLYIYYSYVEISALFLQMN